MSGIEPKHAAIVRCTCGDPKCEQQWHLIDEASPGWTECCEGTGFADYAAVPCPNPSCPTKRRGPEAAIQGH
jgi:hypothetical protein